MRGRANPWQKLRSGSPDRSTTEDPVEKAGRWRRGDCGDGIPGRRGSTDPVAPIEEGEDVLEGNHREPDPGARRRNEELVHRDNPDLRGAGAWHSGRWFRRGRLLERDTREAGLATRRERGRFRPRVTGWAGNRTTAERISDQQDQEYGKNGAHRPENLEPADPDSFKGTLIPALRIGATLYRDGSDVRAPCFNGPGPSHARDDARGLRPSPSPGGPRPRSGPH